EIQNRISSAGHQPAPAQARPAATSSGSGIGKAAPASKVILSAPHAAAANPHPQTSWPASPHSQAAPRRAAPLAPARAIPPGRIPKKAPDPVAAAIAGGAASAAAAAADGLTALPSLSGVSAESA